ncbi:MAG: succinate dehydrogenase cytochrome b subunit [Verrucomicrobiales bacterium]|nr:succinate dehydrogenase cytochrome b subunit [Verrucomicrobiales bacterium]
MNSPGKSLCLFWNSSIGKKIVVAVTGLLLVGFLLGHMAGNLLLFAGRDALNDYAEFLHHMLHGAGIWVARIGLLVALILHVMSTISLTLHNRAARKEKYEHEATVQASKSSRIMAISGLIILAFVIFHILHFTVRIDPELANMPDPNEPGRHDVYGMVLKGFEGPFVPAFYFIAITLLCSHLSHGIASIFQTLGLRSRKTEGSIKALSWLVTALLWVGFLIIPMSAYFKLVSDKGHASTGLIQQGTVADSTGYSPGLNRVQSAIQQGTVAE